MTPSVDNSLRLVAEKGKRKNGQGPQEGIWGFCFYSLSRDLSISILMNGFNR